MCDINNYNDNNNAIIIRKISYRCNPSDAVWTGSKRGAGIVSYNPSTGFVSFNKLWGCDPYWWQFSAAVMSTVPAEDYILKRDRWKPFKISIKEGSSGAIHVFLDEYYFCSGLQKYIKDGKGVKFDISMGEKIPDGLSIEYRDLVEITYKLCEYFDMGFSRNPRWWKRGSKHLWRFERLRPFEVVDNVDHDPGLKR